MRIEKKLQSLDKSLKKRVNGNLKTLQSKRFYIFVCDNILFKRSILQIATMLF